MRARLYAECNRWVTSQGWNDVHAQLTIDRRSYVSQLSVETATRLSLRPTQFRRVERFRITSAWKQGQLARRRKYPPRA